MNNKIISLQEAGDLEIEQIWVYYKYQLWNVILLDVILMMKELWVDKYENYTS